MRIFSLLPPLSLAVVAIAAHLALLPVGFELADSDILPVNLVANAFRGGDWNAFYFDMTYAGTGLSAVRALFTAAWERVSHAPLAHVTSHLAFTYLINPALLAIATWFLVSSYCSGAAAWVVGLVVALGSRFLVTQYPNDTYMAYLILGCALLAIRARVDRPFERLGPRALFAAGALCGFALYTSRASAFYVVPFLIDWGWLKGELRRMIKPRDRLERGLLITAGALVAFYLYLDVVGNELGTYGGRRLKLDAQPNLDYACYLLVALEAKIRWRSLTPDVLRRAAILGAGVALGLMPEWMHFLNLRMLPPPGMGRSVSLPRTLGAVTTLPGSALEVFGAGHSMLPYASVALFAIGAAALLHRARSDRALGAVAFSGGLAVFAYLRYETYVFATSRYLMPVLPAAWVGLGCAVELALARRRTAWIATGAALVALHGWAHWKDRAALVANASARPHLKEGLAILERFEGAGVDIVLSDDYRWASHNLTWLGRERIRFVPPAGPGLRQLDSGTRVESSRRVGVLLRGSPPDSIEMHGHAWRLEPLAEVGGRHLYVGTR